MQAMPEETLKPGIIPVYLAGMITEVITPFMDECDSDSETASSDKMSTNAKIEESENIRMTPMRADVTLFCSPLRNCVSLMTATCI